MGKIKQIIFAILLIILFVEILIVFPKYLEQSSEQNLSENKKEIENTDADQKMDGIHLVESTQGERDWELFSQKAEAFQDKGVWNLKSVKVIFYSPSGVSFVVLANEGKIDTKTKNMIFSGKVKTESSNGYIIKSDLIIYNSSRKILNSPSQIFIDGPSDQYGSGMQITGGTLFCDLKTSNMKITQSIRGTNKIKDKDLKIQSDEATLSGLSHMAEFNGNTKLQYGTMTMASPKAQLQYEKEKSTLQSLSLTGGVLVTDRDKQVTSNHLIVDLNSEQYTFKGNPKVIQNNDEIIGQEIVLLDGGKKMKVERIRAKVDDDSTGRN